MSGLAGSGNCQVRMTFRVAKLTTETDPACAVGDVHVAAVAARVQAVSAGSGGQKADHPEGAGVDLPHPTGDLISGVQRPAVRGELDVLGAGVAAVEDERAQQPLGAQIDLDHPPGELAAGEHVAATRGEVGVIDPPAPRHEQGVHELHRVRVAKVEPLQALSDDDREPAIRGEVQVVGILDRNRAARAPGPRVDRGQAVAEVVIDIQRLEVPGRGDVLGQRAGGELPDHLERPLADDVDRVAHRVGHVDERRVAGHGGAEVPGPVGGIDVDGGPWPPVRCGGRQPGEMVGARGWRGRRVADRSTSGERQPQPQPRCHRPARPASRWAWWRRGRHVGGADGRPGPARARPATGPRSPTDSDHDA